MAAVARSIDRGDFAGAERGLKAIEAAGARCDEALLEAGRLRFAQGDLAAAEELFFRFLSAAPKDARAYYQIARAALAKGEFQRADNFSSTALIYRPDYAEALSIQGRLLAMKGRTAEGQAMLEQACQLRPDDTEAHFELGSLYDRQKRYAEAAGHFERVAALTPQDARAWDYLALDLEPLGQIEKADAAYRKGLAANKVRLSDGFLDYNYGRFLLKQNQLAESKQHLDRAVELAPETRAVHYEHAKLNLRLRNFAEARRDAERALALTDHAGVILDLQVYYALQQIYTQLGETALAQKYAELSRTTTIPPRTQLR